MKKLLSIILCITLCFVLFGCSKPAVTSKYTPILGELIKVTEEGDTLHIKVKVKENDDKKLTIEQNEYNIEDLVVNQNCDKFNSIEYAAVMYRNGKETDALSFTVNKETIQNLKDRKISISSVIARSENVYIASDLRSYKNIEQIAEVDTTESSNNNTTSEVSNNTNQTEKLSSNNNEETKKTSNSNNSNNSSNSNNSYSNNNNSSNNNNTNDSNNDNSDSDNNNNYSNNDDYDNNSSNNSGITVYVSRKGIYHKSPSAHGMKYYTEMTLDEAQSSGYDRCDSCY